MEGRSSFENKCMCQRACRARCSARGSCPSSRRRAQQLVWNGKPCGGLALDLAVAAFALSQIM